MPLLAAGLLPASFRGAAFGVESDAVSGGRRQALHVYPGRDMPWAEDMGRAPRSFSFRGFITTGDVVLGGMPVQLQRALLLAALEKKGPGLLTHPTLGILQVSVTRFSVGQDLGAGRMSSVDVEFVESGKKSFPSLLVSGSAILAALAGVASIAIDLAAVAATVSGVVGGRADAGAAASAVADQVVDAGSDATALLGLAAQLPGTIGRYASGAAATGVYAGDTTVADLVASASTQRAAVATAAAGVNAAAQGLSDHASFATLADAAIALLDALVAACADPADAVRLLLALLATPPTIVAATTVSGAPILMAFQRAACFALAQACAAYQPSSYDDAVSLVASAGAAIDVVAVAAADVGDDASFAALRAVRVALVQDLRARGANLAPITTFTTGAALPALALAQRFYRDSSRADQLVAVCPQAPNPLFMPTVIRALAA